MTTETSPAITLESLEADRVKLSQALDTANATMAEKGPTIFSSGDYEALKPLSDAVSKAKVMLEAADAKIADFRKNSVWEQLTEARTPVVDALRDTFVTTVPTSPLTGVRGTIKIVDGKAEVTLAPIFASTDMKPLNEMIAASVNVKAFTDASLESLTVDISKIGTPEALISVTPTSAKGASKPATASSGTTERSGTLEYQFNGEWLGSKALLEAVEASGHQIATDRSKGFETALRGNGNGLSNLAKDVAEKLGLESRTK